jgi:two-component system OmpR family response regulator
VQRPGQLMSKAQLEERLYAFDDEVESNAIEVHVSRLRKKLGREIIETVRGIGYRLGAGA